MKLDPVKLVKHRQRLGYSQLNVADKSNVNIRTVQRAEAGISISHENAASIAAALQVSPQVLAAHFSDADAAPAAGKTISLRRASSGRVIIDMLDQTAMCKIECDVEPTRQNLELLKCVANLLEANMKDPLDENKLSWPPPRSLAERLDLIASLNDGLHSLEEQGIGVFVAETWLDVLFPKYDPYEGGFWYPDNNEPIGARVARIVISEHGSDKIVRSAWVNWPLGVIRDLDDAVPF